MAWFRNQTRLIHKDNMLLFWQLTTFSTLCNKAVKSPLSVSLPLFPFLSPLNLKYVIFATSREETWLVLRQHETGFLCDLVELPVFQQRKGRLSKVRQFGEAYCTAAPSNTGWALGSHCHSQETPPDPHNEPTFQPGGCWWWELDALPLSRCAFRGSP